MTKMTELATHPIDLDRSSAATWPCGASPTPSRRRAAIAGLWAPDGAEFVEGARFRGHDRLDARIAEAYQEFVASGKYIVASADDATGHHDVITFTIQLVYRQRRPMPETWPGPPASSSSCDDEDLIQEDYQLTVKPLAS